MIKRVMQTGREREKVKNRVRESVSHSDKESDTEWGRERVRE